jgi:hypothetical protein
MLTPIALSHELRTLVRGAISVNSIFVRHLEVPNVVVVPIADKDANVGGLHRVATRQGGPLRSAP